MCARFGAAVAARSRWNIASDAAQNAAAQSLVGEGLAKRLASQQTSFQNTDFYRHIH